MIELVIRDENKVAAKNNRLLYFTTSTSGKMEPTMDSTYSPILILAAGIAVWTLLLLCISFFFQA